MLSFLLNMLFATCKTSETLFDFNGVNVDGSKLVEGTGPAFLFDNLENSFNYISKGSALSPSNLKESVNESRLVNSEKDYEY
jgi:hypothetical protein